MSYNWKVSGTNVLGQFDTKYLIANDSQDVMNYCEQVNFNPQFVEEIRDFPAGATIISCNHGFITTEEELHIWSESNITEY